MKDFLKAFSCGVVATLLVGSMTLNWSFYKGKLANIAIVNDIAGTDIQVASNSKSVRR